MARAGGRPVRLSGRRTVGVSPASAIGWRALVRETGSATPKSRGGDRLSGRIEAQAARIRALIDEKDDLTFTEIRAHLAEEGHHFSVGRVGSAPSPISIPIALCSLMRLGRRPIWYDVTVVLRAASGCVRPFHTGTGKQPPSSRA